MARRRKYELGYGEGSFAYDDARNLWVGRVEAGTTPQGTRRRIVVTAKDKDEAWDRLQVRRKKLLMEGYAAAVQRSITVKAWMTEWLAVTSEHLTPSAQKGAESYARKWIVPTLGSRKIEDLGAADIRRLSKTVMDAGRSSTTAATIQGVFQKALRDARIDGYTVADAVLLVRRPAKAVNDRTAIPVADAVRIIQHVESLPDAARWVAAMLQGMRQGECLGLTWDCVDFDKHTIDVAWQLQALPYADRAAGTFKVPRGHESRRLEGAWHLVRPKSVERVVPMVPWMEAALLAWRQIAPESRHGLVWPRTDGRPRVAREDGAAWKGVQDAARAWKVESPRRYWHLHEARHTTATLLLMAGVDDVVVTAIMGHSDIATSRIYQHSDQTLAMAALERTAQMLQLGGSAALDGAAALMLPPRDT